MQSSKICFALGAAIVLLATAAQYGFGRLPTAHARRLPVESFPSKVGRWTGGPMAPVDPEVQAKLASAAIWERTYSDGEGHALDVMLLTASDSEDLHDPTVCFPSQGWTLSAGGRTMVGGQEAKLMTAALEPDRRLRVLYWMSGYNPPKSYANPALAAVAAVRAKLVGRHEGDSLFVRIIDADEPKDGDAQLLDFANHAAPTITKLVGGG